MNLMENDRIKVLVAGATGYLGQYIVKSLKKHGCYTAALVRNTEKVKTIGLDSFLDRCITAEVTKPSTLKGVCFGFDVVISTIGITRQRDNLTYMDVDFQANMNLLAEAKRAGMKKFIYISVLNAHKMKRLKIIQAKERFVDSLKASGLRYTVIRPNGFFSDMKEFLKMADKGVVHLFGKGEFRGNPIDGEDLAEVVFESIAGNRTEIEVGGPEILTQNQIAHMAFEALHKEGKIRYVPIWIKNIILALIRFFTPQKVYGPIEFFLTVLTMDMVAPRYGRNKLEEFYREAAGK